MAHHRQMLCSLIACIGLLSTPARSDESFTDFFLGGVEKKADRVIDHAEAAGQPVVVAFGREMKDAIEAWKLANRDLLDTAFDRLNDSDRRLFLNINATLDRLENDKAVALQEMSALSSQWGAMVKGLRLNPSVDVSFYQPRVVVPTGVDVIPLDIVDTRISTSNPILTQDNHPILSRTVSDNEIVGRVEPCAIVFDQNEPTYVDFHLTYEQRTAGLVGTATEKNSRDLTILVLPQIMATVEVVPEVPNTTLYERAVRGPFVIGGHGKDSEGISHVVAVPPDLEAQKWELDSDAMINSPHWDDNGGDGDGGSYCIGPMRASFTKLGFNFTYHYSHRANQDAYQKCRVWVPIRRPLGDTENADPILRTLTWTDDSEVTLPPKAITYTIRVRTYNGVSYVLLPNDPDKYQLFEIHRDHNKLVFHPVAPKGF
jgi:hypothetical protein